MPPRKRARLSQAASPAAGSPASVTDTLGKPTDEDILNDPWTDEEETGLFKALIKWKPTGIHKHFRMLQLHDYLLENRYIHPKSEHTTIAGIWHKLASLYDLEALDQREDARQLSDISDEEQGDEDGKGEEEDEDDVYSLAANKIHRETFGLPEADYGEMVWQQRFVDDKQSRDESPAALPELNFASAAPVRFTPSFSIEPEESSTPAPKKRGRPSRGSAREVKAAPETTAKRRSRRAASSVEAESEEQGSDANEAEESEGEEDGEDSVEGEENSEAEAPTGRGRANRGRSRTSARGRPRGRRR